MKTVESHLAADVIAFLDHRQNVRCVLAERLCYEVDIAKADSTGVANEWQV